MIPISSPALYDAALKALSDAVSGRYRGRAAQIFLACKYYSDRIPRIGSAIGIESRELQRLLDELYSKQNRATPDKVAIIFDNAHRVPTGVTAMGLKGGSNIWRNNFNLQKGFICYATTPELQDPTFLRQSRKSCPHLRTVTIPPSLKDAWCELKPDGHGGKRPTYRLDDNPKMFRKDPETDEYTVHDPSDANFYAGIFRPATDTKIPIAALIVAIYYDSILTANRTEVDVGDFLADFDFSLTEAAIYFEDDPTSKAHQALISAAPGITWTRMVVAAQPLSTVAAPALPGLVPLPPPKTAKKKQSQITSPGAIGSTISPPPPAVSGWWDAQQAVRKTLESAGWDVVDTSGLRVGYDFQITKAGTMKLIEVKSSVGTCSAVMTDLEYRVARQMRRDYVLAIVEHFKPSQAANVQWVEDPAALSPTCRQVAQYTLPRSVWRKHTRKIP